MKKSTIQKTKIYLENNEEFNEHWFYYKRDSFICHIDTFYFLVYPKVSNWKEDERKLRLFDILRDSKNKADIDRESIEIFKSCYDGLAVRPYFGFGMYAFHVGLIDTFDIFFCENIPNDKTPPILIQLRSQSLWLDGIKKSFDNVCLCIENILGLFGIEIEKVQENRIDYAYHTNYIQDFINFFPEKYLSEMQVSNFSRWHKEGFFYNGEIGSDYFTLGRRKSNNVFFRSYNKTKEVIEMGYKQFFLPIWLDNGLISKFDEYVLRKAFVYGSYASKDKARCEFYLEYGSCEFIKSEIKKMLDDKDTPLASFSNLAKGLVPDVTLITNIEFQTKRKFYDRLAIPNLINYKGYKYNVYNLFEQLHCILDFLTNDTIRFVRFKGKYKDIKKIDRPYADWWHRLRSTKLLENNWCIDYYRIYQQNLDIERQKLTSINKMARMSAYMSFGSDSDLTLTNDFLEFINTLNDNDISRYYSVKKDKISELKKIYD